MRRPAALLALTLLAGCAGSGTDPFSDDPSYEDAARADVEAIIEGMMRAREDRLRREVRRLMRPETGRPPG